MPKARVFMGDVGSVMLGFVYAGLVVGLSYSLNDFMVLCAFLFPFYADELTTLYVRIKGERHSRLMDRLMKPHRRHLYQLLANEMGVAHCIAGFDPGKLLFLQTILPEMWGKKVLEFTFWG